MPLTWINFRHVLGLDRRALQGRLCATMSSDSNAIPFTWRPKMAKKVTRSRPWTKEEVRMLKTLTREKTKMVIARKLKRSVDAIYGLATKLGLMPGEIEGGKRRGEQT